MINEKSLTVKELFNLVQGAINKNFDMTDSLMSKVIHHALDDLRSNNSKLIADSVYYFFRTDCPTYPFSFDHILLTFGHHPHRIRKIIEQICIEMSKQRPMPLGLLNYLKEKEGRDE